MPATVIAERVGWEGSITWFRDNVRRLRPLYRRPDPADRLVWEAGDAAQCDLWFPPRKIVLENGTSTLLPVPVITLAYSRFMLGRMLPTRKVDNVLLGSWELLRRLGRVPRRLIWDNEAGIGRGRLTEPATWDAAPGGVDGGACRGRELGRRTVCWVGEHTRYRWGLCVWWGGASLDKPIVDYQSDGVLSDAVPSPLPTLRADALSSIGRILEAARRALQRPGSATLSLIAREAGVGIATLYRHFPNRESLATAVMERVFAEEVRPLLKEFCASDASREELLSVAERLVGILERERGVVESAGNIAAVAGEYLGRDHELRDTIARAQAAGNLRPDLEPDDVPTLLAMVTTLPGLLDADPDARRRYLSLLLDGLNPGRSVELPPRRQDGGLR